MVRTAAVAILLFLLTAAAINAFYGPGAGFNRKALPNITFADDKGRMLSPAEFRGKVVLLDFWATWCKPCQDEFPAFDRLQVKLGERGLAIVPVSIDLKGLPAVDAFYARFKIGHLPKYVDDTRESVKALGLHGLPSTLVLDRQGREVTRVEGPADWDSAAVAALLTKLLDE
jgi:thiol-disulfide isomerase/thioredoxin